MFHDVNADGIQNTGDLDLSGVTVELYAGPERTSVLASVTTDANGLYVFDSWLHNLSRALLLLSFLLFLHLNDDVLNIIFRCVNILFYAIFSVDDLYD